MTAIHTHTMYCDTGVTDPDSGAGNRYQFAWAKHSSASALNYSGHPRTVAWSAGQMYEAGDLWVLFSFSPVSVNPGRILNFHNHPNFGGWEPGPSSGVSPVAIDYWGGGRYGSSGLMLVTAAEGQRNGEWYGSRGVWQIMTAAQMASAAAANDWIDLTIHLQLGSYPNGSATVWLNGSDTPVVDTGSASMCWTGQTGYSIWEGLYNDTDPGVAQSIKMVSARVGRTLTEALQDGVDWSITESALIGSEYVSSGANGWTHTALASRDTTDFSLPASLGGSSPPDPEPETLPDSVLGWGDRFPSGGSTSTYGYNSKRAALYTAPDTRDITSIWVYQRGVGTSGAVNRRFFIATSDGASTPNPTTTLVTCSPVSLSAPTTAGWLEIPLPSAFRWAADESYFVGFQTDTGTGDCEVEGYHVTATGERFVFLADTYADGLASPFGTPTDSSTRRILMFFEGALVAQSDPDPPAEVYRLTALSRSGTRTVGSGHTGGLSPGGGL